MPPKRSTSSAGVASKSASKKSRASTESSESSDSWATTDSDDSTSFDPAAHPPNTTSAKKSKRWSNPSGSANVDWEYRVIAADHAKAHKYVCICKLPFDLDGDDEEEEDDEDEDEEEEEEEDEDEDVAEKIQKKKDSAAEQKKKNVRCDGGETCMCDKPASEHPDHPWKLTVAGKCKFFTQNVMCSLRDPDTFNMYTFNDHFGYGVLEVLQNLILDYVEAAGNWREQWAICEGLGYLIHTGMCGAVTQIDDGEGVDIIFQLIGRLFLSMLATLEREKLLSKDSEIMNLGHIMTLYMSLSSQVHDYGLLEDSKREFLGPTKNKNKWCPHEFDRYILAYARKYDIQLTGRKNMDKFIEEIEDDEDVTLPSPEVNNSAKADVFGFDKKLKAYKNNYAGVTAFMARREPIVPIGGDSLDLTTWTSAARKAKSFDGKDPLGKKEIDAIKQGLVLHVA